MNPPPTQCLLRFGFNNDGTPHDTVSRREVVIISLQFEAHSPDVMYK
jgi:hypothetical protein